MATDPLKGIFSTYGAFQDIRSLKQITISGFASHRTPQSIHVRPLTVLAGANSAGKSSAIKPLLLLKQTLDSSTDPGPLLINGPNVNFTKLDQMFTHVPGEDPTNTFEISLEMNMGSMNLEFSRQFGSSLQITRAEYDLSMWNIDSKGSLTLYSGMSSHQIESQLPEAILVAARSKAYQREQFDKITPVALDDIADQEMKERIKHWSSIDRSWIVKRNRCFLRASLSSSPYSLDLYQVDPSSDPSSDFSGAIEGVIHVPAFRQRISRSHPIPETSNEFPRRFPGTFEDYTAAIIAKWENGSEWEKDSRARLARLTESLRELELTSAVSTRKLNDVELELRVARPGRSSSKADPEMVGMADVGVGVSNVLPVLVALEAAFEGQIVYIEQPESHLHPRAAHGLAKALARAANRGVRVIVETHSSLLLLHIQTLVARGELEPESVGLHWFSLDDAGFSKITFEHPDEHGRVGEWPEDFGDVELDAHSQFLRAARAR